MAAIDVVGLGESSIDFVHVVSQLPEASRSKVPITVTFSTCGGQVATAMATCAAFGLSASYLGPVGNDESGRAVMAELSARNVGVTQTIVKQSPTRFALIVVDERTGDRYVLWRRDERLRLLDADVPANLFDGVRVLHVDAVDEQASIRAANDARSRGVLVTSDIDGVADRTNELVAAASVPIFAEQIPARLTGEADLERALRVIRQRHTGLLITTLGDRGSAALDGDRYHHVPAPAVRAVDTTGAGDVFRGAAIYALLQGWPAPELLRFANTAAALSCTRQGALAGIPQLSDVKAAVA